MDRGESHSKLPTIKGKKGSRRRNIPSMEGFCLAEREKREIESFCPSRESLIFPLKRGKRNRSPDQS